MENKSLDFSKDEVEKIEKEYMKRIVSDSLIEEFVTSESSPLDVVKISFLDTEVKAAEDPEYDCCSGMGKNPGFKIDKVLSLKVNEKEFRLHKRNVNAKVPIQQMQDIGEKFSLQVKEMIVESIGKNASLNLWKDLYSEMDKVADSWRIKNTYTVWDKILGFVFRKILNKKYIKREKIRLGRFKETEGVLNKIRELSADIAKSSRMGPATFAIVSPEVASLLQESAKFTFSSGEKLITGAPYRMGVIESLSVYVNPYSTDSGSIIIGRKGQKTEGNIKFVYHPGIKFRSEELAGGVQELSIDCRYAILPLSEKSENFYRKIIYKIRK